MDSNCAKMQRSPAVLEVIARIEGILRESGIAAECAACWRGELVAETHGIGCCQGCELSAQNGCLNKPLSCALWLCHYLRDKYPNVVEQLNLIADDWPRRLTLSYRVRSLDAEQRLYKIG